MIILLHKIIYVHVIYNNYLEPWQHHKDSKGNYNGNIGNDDNMPKVLKRYCSFIDEVVRFQSVFLSYQ